MPDVRWRKRPSASCSPIPCIPIRTACWLRSRASGSCAARARARPDACRKSAERCRRSPTCRPGARSRRAALSPSTAARNTRPTRRNYPDIGPPAGARTNSTGPAMLDARRDQCLTPEPSVVAPAVLEVTNLKKHFPIRKGLLRRTTGLVLAVDGVSFSIDTGETLGLVGESGCGKSTVGRTILRLIEPTDGSIKLDGRDVTHLGKAELRPYRRQMQIIFQDPFSSLDPRMSAGAIVGEPLRVHGMGRRKERSARVAALFDRVGIARALALNPKLIIADEPVSALDVSIQAQVLNLMMDLQRELGLAYLFISHNLAVVEHISHRIAVMYLGRIVEYTDKKTLFTRPLHPYTESLLLAVPVPDPAIKRQKRVLEGDVPSPVKPPPGCHFHTRCPYVFDRCKVESPALREVRPGQLVACHLR